MKRDAINSTKMKKLCKLLNVPLYAAVGMMETLWHITGRETPQGNIGKLSNEDIALALGYEGSADQLIAAMVECHWLDQSEQYRLIIHDWHQHCEDAIDIKLARSLSLYANGSRPRMRRLGVEERAILSAGYSEMVLDGQQIAEAHLCAQMHTEAHDDAQKATESHKKPPPMPMPMPKLVVKEPNGSLPTLGRIPPEELAGTLPLIDGTDYEVSKTQLHDWEKAYPALDIRQQLLAYKEWLKANSTKRKTRKGILRSITYWLSGKQDKAGNPSLFNAAQPKQTVRLHKPGDPVN